MAYNHGRDERKWRIWKEAEEKVLREHGTGIYAAYYNYTSNRLNIKYRRGRRKSVLLRIHIYFYPYRVSIKYYTFRRFSFSF